MKQPFMSSTKSGTTYNRQSHLLMNQATASFRNCPGYSHRNTKLLKSVYLKAARQCHFGNLDELLLNLSDLYYEVSHLQWHANNMYGIPVCGNPVNS